MHKLLLSLIIVSLTAAVSFGQDYPILGDSATVEQTPSEVASTPQETPKSKETPDADTTPVEEVEKPIASTAPVAPQPLPMVEEPTPTPLAQTTQPKFTPLSNTDSTAPGILVITSFPSSAEISLNGTVVGSGNATVSNLLPGRYVITATDGNKTEMKEIVITAGNLTKQDVSVQKKTHMLISMGNMITMFKDDQGANKVALGPTFEIGVSIRNKVFISQDFHWGFWSREADVDSTADNVSTNGQYTAAGGNLKVYWQQMTPKEHFGIFLGAGMGFYSINDYSYYYSYDYTGTTTSAPAKSSFNGDYFGGPSVMMIFGGPIAYGTLSYDLRVGTGVAHSIKLGIATYF